MNHPYIPCLYKLIPIIISKNLYAQFRTDFGANPKKSLHPKSHPTEPTLLSTSAEPPSGLSKKIPPLFYPKFFRYKLSYQEISISVPCNSPNSKNSNFKYKTFLTNRDMPCINNPPDPSCPVQAIFTLKPCKIFPLGIDHLHKPKTGILLVPIY
jgi:hypothetical protein